MTTTKTLVANIKKANESTRGTWVRLSGHYVMNAFDWYHFAENKEDDGYCINVTKENGRWLLFADDHEPCELAALGLVTTYSGKDGEEIELSYDESGFKTLKEAKAWGEAFGEVFQETWEESKDD